MDLPLPLDHRKQQILKAVVVDYTVTAIPVGSHAVAAQLAAWSSATIRNELANLVDVGYLLQPHTSAGRLPSDRGYRYYVDFLMEEEPLPTAVRREMEAYFRERPVALETMLETAALALALATQAVSIVTAPGSLDATVKHLDLVSLDERHALVILVLEGNLIRQQAVELERPADQEELSGLAGTLRAELRGKHTAAVAGLVAETSPGGRRSLRAEVLEHVISSMRAVDSRQDALVVHDGVRNLLRQPEFGDVERLEQVLEVVEQERVLGGVLASLEAGHGIRMMIGTENGLEQLHECSLVVTTYRAGDDRRGTIGVLGPTRMRYSQLAPRVRYISEQLGRALERMLG